MRTSLEVVDSFLERSQETDHKDITPPEARALHALVREANHEDQRRSTAILGAQINILGCAVCSALLAECSPGFTSEIGLRAVTE